jgi:hypothetical protein
VAAPKTAGDFANTAPAAKPAPSAGVAVRSNPKIILRRLSSAENKGLKIMAFGQPGSGKSYTAKALLELGLKIFFLTTDIGGSGLSAIEIPVREEGNAHLLENAYEVQLPDYQTVEKFLKDPQKFLLENCDFNLYEFNPDILFWDGFSTFQQIDVQEFIGNMQFQGKKASAQRESGLQMDQTDWGNIRNATVRCIDRFCALHDASRGKIWHKFVTSHENIKSQSTADGKSVLAETREPALQGAGANFAKGCFDLVMRTKVVVRSTGVPKDEDPRRFEYVVHGNENLASKVRGFKLPPVVPGDMGALFTELLRQSGLSIGQTDASLIKAPEVEVEEVTPEVEKVVDNSDPEVLT